MPAASTDKFVKGSRKLAGTIDSSGISDAVVDNFGLSSVAGLPTDTAVEITVDRVDSNGAKTPAKEEVIRGIVSGSRIVSAVRGVEGTAQAHTAGAVWEVRLTASQWNRHIDGILVEHSQDGSHHFESAPTLKEVATPSNPAAGYRKLYMKADGKVYKLDSAGVETEVGAGNLSAAQNLLKNGNFINNSGNGYGNTPDDFVNSNANPVQGGFPSMNLQEFKDATGFTDAEVELLVNCNGDFNDISANGYNLTPSGSPTDTSEGLMAQAKAFVAASSQYASNAAANARIAGAQTWIAFIRPTGMSATSLARFMGASNVTPTATHVNFILGTGTRLNVGFQVRDLTIGASGTLYSDVVLENDKWYMIVGVLDTANTKLKIWVNGIKKEGTYTGSHTAASGTVAIGRMGDYVGDYFNGRFQMAAVASAAMSDDAVKRFWSICTYKGLKIRRSGTDAYMYQDLPMDVVERLRGKAITLRADLYQAVASTAQISILQTMADGTTDEAIISATDATTGSWLEKYATGTLEADVVGIRIKLKHSTSDGNSWFRRVSIYAGSILLPYEHSRDDWARFPRLLMLDCPADITAYRFEENKVYAYAPTNCVGWSSNPTGVRYMHSGKRTIMWFGDGFTGTSNTTAVRQVPLPVIANNLIDQTFLGILVIDNGTWQTVSGHGRIETGANTVLKVGKTAHLAAWTGTGSAGFGGTFPYESL